MLVVTRRQGEDIDIETPNGERIIIRLVSIPNRKQVRIGIVARREVEVNRHEGFRSSQQDKALRDIIDKKVEL